MDDLLTGGASLLTDGLARGLPISVGQVVSHVLQGPDNVTVVTAGGAAYTAQYAICTAPLGVLQAGAIMLDPGLHPAMQQAVRRLGAGALNQVALWFEEVSRSRSVPGIA